MRLLLIALLLLPLSTQADPKTDRWYSAQDTIRRAEIGTYSPRIQRERTRIQDTDFKPTPGRFDRMVCAVDPAHPVEGAITCKPKGKSK